MTLKWIDVSTDELLLALHRHFNLPPSVLIGRCETTVNTSPGDANRVTLNDVPRLRLGLLTQYAETIPEDFGFNKPVYVRNATGEEYIVNMTHALDNDVRVTFEGGGSYVSVLLKKVAKAKECAADWLVMSRANFNEKYAEYIWSDED
jgi:hypothetical protein